VKREVESRNVRATVLSERSRGPTQATRNGALSAPRLRSERTGGWVSFSQLSFVCSVLALTSGCFVPRDPAPVDDRACTKCHGDPSREGDRALRSAPPFDIFGNTGIEFPGVGAHQLHLTAGLTHGPVACAECHRVPTTLGDEGHNDGKATFTFGAVATGDGGVPAYDFGARRCTTACHGPGNTSGVWTRPRSSTEACGTCHGLPPPAPHPQAGPCAVCHSEVLAPDGGFAQPALHVDGTIQFTNASCDSCHGEPPQSGAHTLHVSGGAQTRPVACATCHEVPARPATPKHPNGGRAEVIAAVNWSTTSSNCGTACHGTTSPVWTSTAELDCASCHGAPPPSPHPQIPNCALCHPNATGSLGRLMTDRTRHVDGVVDVAVPATCDACHGTPGNPAPPRDTRGETATTVPGVGAHQAHVVGRGLARVVQCAECHVMPATVVSGQHLDGVTQVVFSGVARANLAEPEYRGGTCASAACHDVSNYTITPGGGQATTPRWTLVDGSQSTCTSCHGLPPPAPHPQRADCESCHLNATAQRTFVRPELHVDGRVDFATP
jgi:hypothetical protein